MNQELNCLRIRNEDIAAQYVLLTLDDATVEAYEDHYFHCPSCHDELRVYEMLRAAVESVEGRSTQQIRLLAISRPQGSLDARMLECLGHNSEMPIAKSAANRPHNWKAYVGIAAVFLLVTGLVGLFHSKSPKNTAPTLQREVLGHSPSDVHEGVRTDPQTIDKQPFAERHAVHSEQLKPLPSRRVARSQKRRPEKQLRPGLGAGGQNTWSGD
jgi:hypothetical protein